MIFYFTLLAIVIYAKDTVARSKSHFNSKSSFGKFYLFNYNNNIEYLYTSKYIINLYLLIYYIFFKIL